MPPKSSPRRSIRGSTSTTRPFETYYLESVPKDKAIRQLIDHSLISKGGMTQGGGETVAIDENGFNVLGNKSYIDPIHKAINTWKYDPSDSEDEEDPLEFEGHRDDAGRMKVSIKRRSHLNPGRLHGVRAIREESNAFNAEQGLDEAGESLEPAEPEDDDREPSQKDRDVYLDRMLVNPHNWQPKSAFKKVQRKIEKWASTKSNVKVVSYQATRRDFAAMGLTDTLRAQYTAQHVAKTNDLVAQRNTLFTSVSALAVSSQDAINATPSDGTVSPSVDGPTKKVTPTRWSTRARRQTAKAEETERPTKRRRLHTPEDKSEGNSDPAPPARTSLRKRAAFTETDQLPQRPTKKLRVSTARSDDEDAEEPVSSTTTPKRVLRGQGISRRPKAHGDTSEEEAKPILLKQKFSLKVRDPVLGNQVPISTIPKLKLKGPKAPSSTPPPTQAKSHSQTHSQAQSLLRTQTQAATTKSAAASQTSTVTRTTARGNRDAAAHGTEAYSWQEEEKLMELAASGPTNSELLRQLNAWLAQTGNSYTHQRQGDSVRQHIKVLQNEGCTPKILRVKRMSWRNIKAKAKKEGRTPVDDVSDDDEDEDGDEEEDDE